eukprot:TRINITY_DN11401_c0_g1_i2.p1 TRINITY_DN11401_c0_g1~~TRINITY_DN11401_c0_g1_i2.p1  ORF type:complete len:118 (-),score=38.23 TRINITY_DN11401_c0_g1_i2:245-598(-)
MCIRDRIISLAKWGIGCSICTLGLSWVPFFYSGLLWEIKPLKQRYDEKGIFVPPCFAGVCEETGNISKERCEALDGPMPKLEAFMGTPRGQKMMDKINRMAAKKKEEEGKPADKKQD